MRVAIVTECFLPHVNGVTITVRHITDRLVQTGSYRPGTRCWSSLPVRDRPVMDGFHPSNAGSRRTAKAMLPSVLAALGDASELPSGHHAPAGRSGMSVRR